MVIYLVGIVDYVSSQWIATDISKISKDGPAQHTHKGANNNVSWTW